MIIIYIIIGCALASLIIKIIKAIERPKTNNQNSTTNNNNSISIKDGMNLYLGKVVGKIIILTIGIIIILLLPLLTTFLVK